MSGNNSNQQGMAKAKAFKFNIKGLDTFHEKKAHLIKSKSDFSTMQTTYTAKIKRAVNGNSFTEFYFEEAMRKRDFFLMMQLRKMIESNSDKVKGFDASGIKYCVYNYHVLRPRTILFPVTEIDINSAYINACLNLGLIDQKMYDRMTKIDKIKRLRLLGAIATRNVVTDYEGGKLSDTYIKNDSNLRHCWFSIVKTIDTILLNLAEMHDNFLFYYVDGIYISGTRNVESICNSLSLLNYPFKVKENLRVIVGKTGDLKVIEPDGDERIFNTRKSDFRKFVTV